MSGPNDKPSKPRGKWLKWAVFLGIMLLLAAALVHNYCWPSNRHFTISPETTYISGPLNDDGTINYVAALNEMMSKGVTRENNAAPLLVQAWGAEMIPPGVRDKVFKILQMEPVTETGARGPDLEDVVQDIWPKGAPKGAETRPSPDYVKEHTKRVLKRAMEGPWSADELPAVAAWLKANEERLALVTEAAKRPRYYIPLVTNSDPPRVFSIPIYMVPTADGEMYVARAMNKLNRGDVHAAWADLRRAHNLARLVSQGHELSNSLAALTFEEAACKGDVALAASGRLNPAQARNFLGQLGELPPLAISVDPYLLNRFMLLDIVMGLYRSKDPIAAMASEESDGNAGQGTYTDPLDWDYLLRAANSAFDPVVPPVAGSQPAAAPATKASLKDFVGFKARYGPIERLLALFGGRAGKHWRTRLITEAFVTVTITMMVPVVVGLDDYEHLAATRLELARLSLALAAFKAEKGEYPQKLSELSPVYIEKIPQDSFTNKPLIYKRDGKGYLLYSVGRNMKDDGGVKTDDDAGKQSKMPEVFNPVGKVYDFRNREADMTDDGGEEDEDTGKDDIAVRVK